jgi:hypothetical protein
VLIGVTYLVVALCILLGCQPMNKYWQISPDPGSMFLINISILLLPWQSAHIHMNRLVPANKFEAIRTRRVDTQYYYRHIFAVNPSSGKEFLEPNCFLRRRKCITNAMTHIAAMDGQHWLASKGNFDVAV